MAKNPVEKTELHGVPEVETRFEDPGKSSDLIAAIEAGVSAESNLNTKIVFRHDDAAGQSMETLGDPADIEKLSAQLGAILDAIQALQALQLRELKVDVVLSIDMGTVIDDKHSSLASDFSDVLSLFQDPGIDRAIELATQHGIWSFCHGKTFAVTLIPSLLRQFQSEYGQVEAARKKVDEQREQWLHGDAEPLLNSLEEKLRDPTVPAGLKVHLTVLRHQLTKDAYYRGIIETSDVAAELEVVEEIVRRYARNGRLGLPLSRHYVFSQQELRRFMENRQFGTLRSEEPPS